MNRSLLYVGLAAAAGFLIARALPVDSPSVETVAPVSSDGRGVKPGFPIASVPPGLAAATEAEFADLRRRLREETRARREIERKLEAIEREIAALQTDLAREPAEGPGSETGPEDSAARASNGRAWFDEQALIAAGMDGARAFELRLFFEQLELERMRLRDRAAREGWERSRTRTDMASLDESEETLRERIGESGYEAYLYASGRPNRVAVASLLETAPAGQAGIRPGDHILRYANQRIYNRRELRAAIRAGEFGDPVEVEIERDGESLQFYLARGPLGVRTNSISIAP